MGFELTDRVMGLNVQLQSFMDKHIYPREYDWHEWCLDQDLFIRKLSVRF